MFCIYNCLLHYCIPVSIMEFLPLLAFLYNFVQHLFLSWIENGRDDRNISLES